MGKSLKGKELGKGISQRKDGLYTGRFTSQKTGKPVQQYFKSLQECKNWYADAKFADENGSIFSGSNMTLDVWFEYWIENMKKPYIKDSTYRDYKNKYIIVKTYFEKMKICDIKPIHCQEAMNKMNEKYSPATVKGVRSVLHGLFDSAVDNDLIAKNPINKSIKTKQVDSKNRVLSLSEQKEFLKRTNDNWYSDICSFILQTGLRISEARAIRWNDIDFSTRMMSINKQIDYVNNVGWVESTPKSKNSIRKIPLTEEAIRILKKQKSKHTVIDIRYKDFIFLTKRGNPIHKANLDKCLYQYCVRNNVERFSAHTLRHTFATRCIEAGMKPKTLQKILGHANIMITMDLYVHITEEEEIKEMLNVENDLFVV